MFLFPCVSLCFVTMATAARAELFSSAWCFNRFRPVPQHDAFGFFPCKNTLPCPPPNVATLGECRWADDFRSHPGVGAGSAHLGCAVPLSSQSKVCDLQSLVAEIFHLNPLKDKDWTGWQCRRGKWWGNFIAWWGRGWRMWEGEVYVQIGGRIDVKIKGFSNRHQKCLNVGEGSSSRSTMIKHNACGNAKNWTCNDWTKQGAVGGRPWWKDWKDKSGEEKRREQTEKPRNGELLQ